METYSKFICFKIDFVEEFLKKELKEIMHKTYLPMIFEKTDLICKEKFLELFYSKKLLNFYYIFYHQKYKNQIFKQ